METQVRLDGQSLDVPSKIQTLESLLEHLMQNNLLNDREIIEVKVDNETFSESFAHEAMLIDLKEISSVDVITESKEALALATLEQFPYFIYTIRTGFRTAANLLRDYNTQQTGQEILASSADSLNHFITHFSLLLQNIKNGKSSDLTEAFNNLTIGLAELLDEILVSQQAEDPMLLADLIEYEIVPILERVGIEVERVLN